MMVVVSILTVMLHMAAGGQRLMYMVFVRDRTVGKSHKICERAQKRYESLRFHACKYSNIMSDISPHLWGLFSPVGHAEREKRGLGQFEMLETEWYSDYRDAEEQAVEEVQDKCQQASEHQPHDVA